MAGLSGRFSTMIKAKVSKLLDRAEDPSETLDYSYEKQLELLQNVKKGIADVVTAKKRLQLQSQKHEQAVVKLDTQARQALASGNEELARTALERKTAIQNELQGLDQQVTELEAQQQQLIDKEAQMRQRIDAFRSKKEVIKAQYSAAEAQVRIGEAASGVGEEMADVGLAMQRAVDKTENMKARAGAVEELEAAGTFDDITQLGDGKDDIDRQLESLTTSTQVDDELAKMKAELGAGSGGGAGELEAGKQPETGGASCSSALRRTGSTSSTTTRWPSSTSSTTPPLRRSTQATRRASTAPLTRCSRSSARRRRSTATSSPSPTSSCPRPISPSARPGWSSPARGSSRASPVAPSSR